MRDLLIDDASNDRTARGTEWRLVSDQVMGGMSDGTLRTEEVAGRRARRLTGHVSLENDGGFLQMALDLEPDGEPADASDVTGIEVMLRGNGAEYNVHLRTADVVRPWQSYRLSVPTTGEWTTHRLPFADARAHRIDAAFDPTTLRRIGLVAIGREMEADLALARLAFYV
ncbi:CIA30 family protein [Palleronia sp. LCG004]|uniref:CIA30 family protein n=1 Tax=Palleronia sp. LCG004 TaxID=3079304 RepID=UPI002942F476|nr:CIA30 family protein [Palleronia sp. LCG004]WOI56388.1 CIA30 family protein [Palleronia sp. LCG004]